LVGLVAQGLAGVLAEAGYTMTELRRSCRMGWNSAAGTSAVGSGSFAVGFGSSGADPGSGSSIGFAKGSRSEV